MGKLISDHLLAPRLDKHVKPVAISSFSAEDCATLRSAMTVKSKHPITAADLKAMAQDIKKSVTDAIADLRLEVHVMNNDDRD